ncbi:MAG: recombinase family protein [Leptolyngbyaceae cyanobacterium SM2_5_2]|nr:recombinase family protein [Leptolyngbyaceae cyanobacterium SM2_5_2]
MRIVAYCYQAPALKGGSVLEPWASIINQVYEDIALLTEPAYRPQLAQLKADNQTQPADVVLVDGFETLGHSLAAVQDCLSALADNGSLVVNLTSQPMACNLARGQDLAKSQNVAMPEYYRRQGLRAGHARNRLNALPPPGKAPYGYRRGQERYLLDRTTAPVISAFINDFLLYGSLRGAVRSVETRFGKRIAVSTGRRWLTHPVYRGDLQYQDGQVMRDTHRAIISRDEAAQIDRLLRRNSQLPPRTAGAPRSLAGLVSCQTCGCTMTVSNTTIRGKAQSYQYLRPSQCPRSPRCKAIAYNDALHQIILQICQDLPQAVARLQASRPRSETQPMASPADFLQAQIQQKNAALAQLPALLESDVLDAETTDLRRYKLRGEIADLAQQIAQLPPVNLQELSQSVSIPQFWLDLSEAERRFFFREFIRNIQIMREGDDWQVNLVLVF